MPLNPRNKRVRPYGQPQTPFDPITGTYVPLGDPSPLDEFTIEEVGYDLLMCTDRHDQKTLVAKAEVFRRSEWDGEEIGGTTYAATGLGERSATDADGIVTPEIVTPHYVVGEKILAAKMIHGVDSTVTDGEFTANPDVKTGDYLMDWEDANRAARRWEVPGRIRARLVTNRVDGNLLDCQFLNAAGEQSGAVVVARPDDLRAQFYAGVIGGVTYTKTDQDTRDAVNGVDPDEVHVVTPPYVADKSILFIERLPLGAGIADPAAGIDVRWVDATPGRSWAVDPNG